MDTLNKFAEGEGLKYVSQEFKSIEAEIKTIIDDYRKDFAQNSKNKASDADISVVKKVLDRNQNLLSEFKKKIKSMVGNFIKSIERNHRKEIAEHLGEDYAEHLAKIVSNPEEAYNPTKGAYIKYKLIFQLLRGEDRDLINRVTKYIEYEVKIYETKFDNIRRELDQMVLVGQGKDVTDYSWVGRYAHLFKFAQEVLSDKDIEEVNIESIGLKLRDVEIKSLKAMIELWKIYKGEFDSSKYAAILENKLDLLRRIFGGFIEIEKKRNDMLESTFDSIRALYKFVTDYINEGNKEKEFYMATGLSFSNAFAKIDNYVYTLSTLFPASVQISKFIQKMPRKYIPGQEPVLELQKEKAIEKAPVISPTTTKEKELIFKDIPKKMPRYMPAQAPAMAYYKDALELIKKAKAL